MEYRALIHITPGLMLAACSASADLFNCNKSFTLLHVAHWYICVYTKVYLFNVYMRTFKNSNVYK